MNGTELIDTKLFGFTGDIELLSAIGLGWNGEEIQAGITLIPTVFALHPAYPNPFNPVTTLNFALPVETEVSISIYNLQGREITSLISGNMDAGYHSVIWNADAHASGVYFVKMIAGEYINTQKLMLVK